MDTDQTVSFITTLEPNENHVFCWFGLHPDGQRLQAYGTLEEMLPKLAERNAQGYSIFVTVNAIDNPAYSPRGDALRRGEDVTRVRAAFADWDDPNREPPGLPLPPTMVVESSPRKFHFYWLADDIPLAEFENVQRGIAQALGSDKSIIDLSRVMRVPGFLHTKDIMNPAPVLLDDASGPTYSFAQLKEAFPFDPAKARTKFSTWNGRDIERKTAQTAAIVAAQYLPRLDGGYDVRCPWDHEHTTVSSPSSTTYWPPADKNDGRGSFVCLHAHCREIRMVDEYDNWIARNVAAFIA